MGYRALGFILILSNFVPTYGMTVEKIQIGVGGNLLQSIHHPANYENVRTCYFDYESRHPRVVTGSPLLDNLANRGRAPEDAVLISFEITRHGRTKHVVLNESSIQDVKFVECVKRKVREWRFSSRLGPRWVKRYPIGISYRAYPEL